MAEKVLYSWVNTHNAMTKLFASMENQQGEMIALLIKVGITPLNDKNTADGPNTPLEVIDPFTFYSYINKYGSVRRLQYLQAIAHELNLEPPTDESGLPTAQPQKVWLFPYKYNRKGDELQRLWSLFHKAISDSLNNEDFKDALSIPHVGKAKLTEGLFYVAPEQYFPIDRPTITYLKENFNIVADFETFIDYNRLLEKIREKSSLPFYQISHDAWVWFLDHNDKFKAIINALKASLGGEHGFKFNKTQKRYVWVGDNQDIIGSSAAHYEIIKRRNKIAVELHFEDASNKKKLS